MSPSRLALSALLLLSIAGQALERQPTADYHARRVHLADGLKGGIAVVFAAEEPQLDFMPYRQDEDFYYLTGWNEPGAALVLVAGTPSAAATETSAAQAARPYREIL